MNFKGISGHDIEKLEVRTIYQLRKIKVGFQARFPTLMANIIRILLYKKEEKLACYLTAFYEISLDEELLQSAVNNGYYEWLNYVWAFKKNYTGDIQDPKEKHEIKIEALFGMIHKRYPPDQKDLVTRDRRICCEWYLDNADNHMDDILKALLTHQEDQLALDFMGYYSVLLDDKLFLFSLDQNNQEFIR